MTNKESIKSFLVIVSASNDKLINRFELLTWLRAMSTLTLKLFVQDVNTFQNKGALLMAYSVKSKKSGKMYYLHTKEVQLAAGRKQRIYYFAGEAGSDSLDALPTGYEVIENERTGLPMLRKKK